MWCIAETPKIPAEPELKKTSTMLVYPDGSYEQAGEGAAELFNQASQRYLQTPD